MNEPKSKTAAVISYLTWVGWIAAFFIRDKSCEFTRRHLNQAICINILETIGVIIAKLPFIGSPIGEIIDIIVLVVWIIGISRAARGIWKPIPILGEIDLIQ